MPCQSFSRPISHVRSLAVAAQPEGHCLAQSHERKRVGPRSSQVIPGYPHLHPLWRAAAAHVRSLAVAAPPGVPATHAACVQFVWPGILGLFQRFTSLGYR